MKTETFLFSQCLTLLLGWSCGQRIIQSANQTTGPLGSHLVSESNSFSPVFQSVSYFSSALCNNFFHCTSQFFNLRVGLLVSKSVNYLFLYLVSKSFIPLNIQLISQSVNQLFNYFSAIRLFIKQSHQDFIQDFGASVR